MNERTRLLLKLQRTLWSRTMTGNPAVGVVTVLVVLYALIGLVSLMSLLQFAASQGLWSALGGVTAVGMIAYLAVTVLLPSGESQLRPSMFSSLPVTTSQLMPALGWASLLTSRGILALLCTTVTTVVGVILLAGSGHLVAAVALPVAMLLALVTTLLLGELLTLLGSGSGRVSRERTNVIGAVLVIAFLLGISLLTGVDVEQVPVELIGQALAWTPFGAAAGAVGSAVQGRWLLTLAQLAIAVATLALGAWWWRRIVTAQLEAPVDALGSAATPRRRREEGGRIPVLLPGLRYGPAAMVYARAVRYLFRDSRMLASLVMFPLIAAFLLFQGVTVHESTILFGMVLLGLLVSTLGINDFGYDGPASWVNLVSGVPTRTLLLARHAASLSPMVLLWLVFTVLGVIVVPSTGVALLVAAVSAGAAVSSSMIALLFTTFNPFPTSRPGTNPWADKSGFSGAALLSSFASLLFGWLPVAPGGALVAVGYLGENTWVTGLGLVFALALPVMLYAGTVVLCTRRVERKMPEIYDRVRSWVS